MVRAVFDRFPSSGKRRDVRTTAAALLAVLSVRVADPPATQRLDMLTAAPDQSSAELLAVVHALRGTIAFGGVPGSVDDARVRAAGLARFVAIAQSAAQRMDQAAAAGGTPPPPRTTWADVDVNAWFAAMSVVSAVAQETYFGSRAYDARPDAPTEKKPDEAVLARFASEGRILLSVLTAVGWPAVVHHVIDTLRALVPFDPRGILALASDAVSVGRDMGYTGESLAMTQVVELVTDYLANHRGLLVSDRAALDRLVEILNAFAELGWEAAIKLVYRLDEIYR